MMPVLITATPAQQSPLILSRSLPLILSRSLPLILSLSKDEREGPKFARTVA